MDPEVLSGECEISYADFSPFSLSLQPPKTPKKRETPNLGESLQSQGEGAQGCCNGKGINI